MIEGVDLRGKRALVTGGASDIGTETVRALVRAGADVTVAVRRPDSVQELATAAEKKGWRGTIRAARLDLSDLQSVRSLTAACHGPLHILVANAGIMAVPQLERTREGWELKLATNYLGHFALAAGLHPALRTARAARVVVVSSGAHRNHPVDLDDPQFEHTPYDPWAAYGRSKSADVLLAVGIAPRWAEDGITANALMPGWITTNLQRHIDLATLQAMGAADQDGNRIEKPHYKTPAQGAATSVLLAASPYSRASPAATSRTTRKHPSSQTGPAPESPRTPYARRPPNSCGATPPAPCHPLTAPDRPFHGRGFLDHRNARLTVHGRRLLVERSEPEGPSLTSPTKWASLAPPHTSGSGAGAPRPS